MEDQQFSLKWNNYTSSLLTAFSDLKDEDAFVDVTLACDGHLIKAHKVILSACSVYFKTIFQSNPCQHPVIFLKDVKFYELQLILSFIYNGEVNVLQKELPSLLKTAEALKIKGLAEDKTSQEKCKKGLEIEFGRSVAGPSSIQHTLNPNLEMTIEESDYGSPLKKLRKLSSQFDIDKNSKYESSTDTAVEPESYDAEIKIEEGSDIIPDTSDDSNLPIPQGTSIFDPNNGSFSKGNQADNLPQAQGWGHFCNICNKQFPSKAKLTHHVEARHLPNKAGYVCNICGKTALTKNAVYIHRSRYHSSWKCFPKNNLDTDNTT